MTYADCLTRLRKAAGNEERLADNKQWNKRTKDPTRLCQLVLNCVPAAQIKQMAHSLLCMVESDKMLLLLATNFRNVALQQQKLLRTQATQDIETVEASKVKGPSVVKGPPVSVCHMLILTCDRSLIFDVYACICF